MKLQPGDEVIDRIGPRGAAVVLKRCGRGEVIPVEYVRVRWTDGHETTEPVYRFGDDCS